MTPKQQRFVDEYLIDLNATQAAIRAGYAKRGARTEGARLLANADVAAAIANRIEQRSEETCIDAAWVLREAKEVYLAAKQANKLSEALRALEIVGKHVDVQAFREQADQRVTMSADQARNLIAELAGKYAPLLANAGQQAPVGLPLN